MGVQQAASGKAGRIALVAATAADARDVLVEGQSGILAVSPPRFQPVYEPWPTRPPFGNPVDKAIAWPSGRSRALCEVRGM
jgi:phage terminase large subunit-like protein